MKRVLLVFSLLLMGLVSLFATAFSERSLIDSFDAQGDPQAKIGQWARKTLSEMTLDEKIGQLFMIAAYSNKNEAHVAEIEKLIKDYHLGGLIVMQGGPNRQISMLNRFQKAAKYPLLISADYEWGLAMRLDSTVRFPKNMTLGAIRDNALIFEMGQEVGRQTRRVGVQVNFAPVVDVNNNPRNPVINDRSFGELRDNVADKGIMMFKGMEYSGTIGCAKHFPGHGDTDTDSHLDLPVIGHDRSRLDSIEIYTFRKLIAAGVPSVMVAHLYIPALDTTKNLASTLSPKIVQGLLKDQIGFKGLSFTDALGMQGVTKFFEDGETDLRAFLAGNDVLLFSKDVPTAVKKIKEAVAEGKVTEQEIDRRVIKILIAKEWAGLHQQKETKKIGNIGVLNTPEAFALRKRLYQAAITVPRNEGKALPLGNLSGLKVACIEIGTSEPSAFYHALNYYMPVERLTIASGAAPATRAALIKKLKGYDVVIVGLLNMSRSRSKNYGITGSVTGLISELGKQEGLKTVTCVFGSPYSLKNFGKEDAVLVAYEDAEEAQEAAAEAIFGAIDVDGRLPVTGSDAFKAGMGQQWKALNRLHYALPEAAGMDSYLLDKIDSVAQAAIAKGATPGCAVLVARGDKVVFQRGYGRTEYKGGERIDPEETLYDLASVTKVMATTVTVMRLVDEGKLNLDESISAYLADFRGRNMTHIKVRNLLMHNAGFKAWIPFYNGTFSSPEKEELREDVFRDTLDAKFCLPVTGNLYMCVDYLDTMWLQIVNSEVDEKPVVRYSDLSMIVMARIIEKVTGTTLDRYADSVFYGPLGMHNTAFLPSKNLPGRLCAPTEMDNYWRKEKIQGYVHDQAAAMMGGVSGHAGLFSTTSDISKLLAMLKAGGSAGGIDFIKSGTIRTFSKKQLDDSRKGLGFDKCEMREGKSTPCSRRASAATYGHTGFTGTCVWVDPEKDLIFVFLSNRTFPDANNRTLIKEDVRETMMDFAYQAIESYEGR